MARAQAPIIDMHLHAHSLSMYGGGASVCAGDQAISFPGVDPAQPMSLERLNFRRLFSEGKVAVLAEIGAQYRGLSLADPSYEPYFAMAEELDIPVGVHLGEGPPGGPYWAEPDYRAALTSPLQLEPVLIRHPRLRVWVMHYGSPLVDDMIALLYSHPQVYVDIAQNDWGFPRAHFYAQLKRLIDAGFAKRIMWGSDQMIWPETIRVAIETIQSADFLTAEQKRDIFYDNAARFLRLSDAEKSRHRTASAPGPVPPLRSTAVPGFTARVTSTGARFVFPLANRPTWEWNRPTTPDNHAEYMWAVQVDNGGRAYEFGFYRFKFAGAKPARGSLGDLLFTGQQTVAERSGPQASVLAEARVSVTEERGRLVVGVEDAKTLQLLFSDRPRRAVFRIEVSGEKGVTREVQVEYDP